MIREDSGKVWNVEMALSRDLVNVLHSFWDNAAVGEQLNKDDIRTVEAFILRLYDALDKAEESETGKRKTPDA